MRPSFSLRGLFAAVLTLGVGCAAVASPSDWCASGLFSAVLLLLALAVLRAALSRGPTHAACAGFAWLGGVYLMCAYGPWFSERISPHLPTSRLVRPWGDYLHELTKPSVAGAVSIVPKGMGIWEVQLVDGTNYRTNGPDIPHWQSLAAIVHSLASLVLALIGALAGRWFYESANRGRQETQRTSDVP